LPSRSVKVWQTGPLGAWTALHSGAVRRGRFVKGRIQAKPGDAGHALARQRCEQLQGGQAPVGHKHQLALREPTADLPDPLTGPVGERLVVLPMLAARALGGRQGGEASKMSERTLRRLFIIGASGVLRWAARNGAPAGSWMARMLVCKPPTLVRVALANKMARIIWALMARGGLYRAPAVSA
jgi:hypothetical protein